MTKTTTRRGFLKLTSATGAMFLLAGCGSKDVTAENRNIVDRLVGRPVTDLPQIENAWTYEDNTLTLDMSKLPELAEMGGAVRIEGEMLSDPILVVYGEDGEYYALKNACTHANRKIDPLAGTMTLECCSVNQSTFDYAGNVLSGPAKEPLTSYAISADNEMLRIELS